VQTAPSWSAAREYVVPPEGLGGVIGMILLASGQERNHEHPAKRSHWPSLSWVQIARKIADPETTRLLPSLPRLAPWEGASLP